MSSAKTWLKSLVLRSSRKAFAFGLLSLGSFAIASPSLAANVNFSNLNTWDSSGDVVNNPTQATLSNAISPTNPYYPDDSVNYNVSNNDPISAFDLETFLNLNAGTLGVDATEGSAIKTTLTGVTAGDVISFDWNFFTNDIPNFDRAFVTIGNSVSLLTGNSGRFTSGPLNQAASYIIGIGVLDGNNDYTRSSRLTLSNLSYQPVPEPLTIVGSLTALGFGVSLRRKFHKLSKM